MKMLDSVKNLWRENLGNPRFRIKCPGKLIIKTLIEYAEKAWNAIIMGCGFSY